jgi:catechol 2,3-dioxygenase-like lactoylglutathione lyase family enzyme
MMATIAVRDLDAAREFYEGKLGFTLQHAEGSEAVTYRSGNATFLVYRSQHAGTNKATSATWNVSEEIGAVVGTLRDAGVPFEHYDMPETRREGDIHLAGSLRVAWCKDPDGNILALVGE